jgi:tRNA dimethylallyltransferase
VTVDLMRAADVLVEHAQAHPDTLLGIVGPTASGKTDLAMSIAERLGAEIISADSVQVYRAFDIGSGKPTSEERARVPHHLVDVADPLEPMDAARWARLGDAAIEDVRARGRRPILCGGTYLWVRALVSGLVETPPADEVLRAEHRALVVASGRVALHDRLRAVDPAAAARLHPNDVVRVSRALEVFELTGTPLSEQQAAHAFGTRRHEANLFALTRSAEELTQRIEARVVAWLEAGWIDEVRSLLERGYGGARAMNSVGYAEVHAHLRGEIARDELAIAIVRKTRSFARRQRTWLRRAPITWL